MMYCMGLISRILMGAFSLMKAISILVLVSGHGQSSGILASDTCSGISGLHGGHRSCIISIDSIR